MPKKINKNPVNIQEGKQIFHDYYKKKHKGKSSSVKQAKLFDAVYQKKPKKTFGAKLETSKTQLSKSFRHP